MAKIVIGGETHVIPEMNFMALERAWPYVEAAMVRSGSDPMAGPLAAMRVIAAGIMEDENFQPQKYGVTATPDDPDKIHEQIVFRLRKKLKAKEISALSACIEEIIVEAGLSSGEGELQPEETPAEKPSSTETALDTSQSSSLQDAKDQAG